MQEPEAQRKALASSPLTAIVARTLSAVIVAAAIAVGGAVLVGGFAAGSWAWAQPSDSLPDSERQARQRAFDAIGSLRLAAIPAADIDQVIAEMHLPEPARQALTANVAPTQATAAPATAPAAAPTAAPQAAAQEAPRLRLVSITLWDTDVEDGDVVRIDSEGFSRTIVLTKGGSTIAVPLPANGVVRITGINDGDGGGITVGLASGAAKVVFPIMSVGQALQLAAVVR